MKIWFEALTGKQAMLFHYMANQLEKEGHSSLFTTRSYDYTEKNLDRLGRKYKSVGTYGGASLKSKLIASSNRIIKLAELVDKAQPDLLISFPSPGAHRTAFGLGIPIIQINDTPHARAVAQLTLSLSNYLIYPDVIERKLFNRYGVTNYIPYDGVDEVLWVKHHTPDPSILYSLGLEKNKYVVLRCEESKAAYFKELYPSVTPGSTTLTRLVPRLREKHPEYNIVAFPRYTEQENELEKLDVIIPDQSVDTLSLLTYASVMMTGGGTMSREAALLGTPSIYTFPEQLAVSNLLADRGFPLYHFPDHLAVPDKIIELLDHPHMEEEKRKRLLDDLQTPLTGVKIALAKLFG